MIVCSINCTIQDTIIDNRNNLAIILILLTHGYTRITRALYNF